MDSRDLVDYDDNELSPEFTAQLERLEQQQIRREQHHGAMRRQKLRSRRDVEDWHDARRMREQTDLLNWA